MSLSPSVFPASLKGKIVVVRSLKVEVMSNSALYPSWYFFPKLERRQAAIIIYLDIEMIL